MMAMSAATPALANARYNGGPIGARTLNPIRQSRLAEYLLLSESDGIASPRNIAMCQYQTTSTACALRTEGSRYPRDRRTFTSPICPR